VSQQAQAKEDLPKGYTCTKCGAFHRFTAYVYSHWDMPLTHLCDCGVHHDIMRGTAAPVYDSKKEAP